MILHVEELRVGVLLPGSRLASVRVPLLSSCTTGLVLITSVRETHMAADFFSNPFERYQIPYSRTRALSIKYSRAQHTIVFSVLPA
jgi:uncharacterized protein involved in cysteine biosynthesis